MGNDRGRLETLFSRFVLSARLLFDRRVDTGIKLVPLLAVLYVLSPVDFMPELVLGPLGAFDDIGVLLLGMEAFIRLAPREVVQSYSGEAPPEKRTNEEDIIEGEYVVRDR